jgi:hypothetical protein
MPLLVGENGAVTEERKATELGIDGWPAGLRNRTPRD